MAHGWGVPHTWSGYALAIATALAVSLPPAWLTCRLVERRAIEFRCRTNPLARFSTTAPAAVRVVPPMPPATGRGARPARVNRVG
jgi:peptidoglycan/LPS O-acetylase OafA/YrhL